MQNALPRGRSAFGTKQTLMPTMSHVCFSAIGTWAGASAITTSLGPVLGGFLIDALHWRSIFLINLPLSAAVIVLALRYVPESRNEMVSGPLDWLGGLLAVVTFGSLAAGLTLISETSGANALAIPALCFGAIASILFVLHEARAASPIMPLSLFGNRIFLSANIMTLFLYGALTGILFLLPFDLIESRGCQRHRSGLRCCRSAPSLERCQGLPACALIATAPAAFSLSARFWWRPAPLDWRSVRRTTGLAS